MNFLNVLLTYMAMVFSLNVSTTTVPELSEYLVVDDKPAVTVPYDGEVVPSAWPTINLIVAPSPSQSPSDSPSPGLPTSEPTSSPSPTQAPTTAFTASPSPTATPSPSPSPSPTPMPTASPSPSPSPTAAPTASPSPSPSPTPTPIPQPTITPNPNYKTLRKNNKGEAVLQMQTRLQELGYYKGELDGWFAAGTESAVLRFQKRNNLSGDGIAGHRTLTILFESPHVIWAEGVTTPSPSPAVTIPIP